MRIKQLIFTAFFLTVLIQPINAIDVYRGSGSLPPGGFGTMTKEEIEVAEEKERQWIRDQINKDRMRLAQVKALSPMPDNTVRFYTAICVLLLIGFSPYLYLLIIELLTIGIRRK